MKTVIGIVGQPASGKGTIAAYLKDRYGAHGFRFSDVLFETLDRLGVPATRDNLIKLSELLRGAFGETALAQAIAAGIGQSSAALVVVDGVRREGDIITLRRIPGFHLLAVDAKPEVRYERALARAEKAGDATMSFEGFLALERRSTEVSARELEKKAEATFENDGSFEDLYAQVDAWLASIGIVKG